MDKNNNKPSKLGEILKDVTKDSVLDIVKKEAKRERDKAYDFRKIFEQMELNLISSMKKVFYFHQREELKEGFQFEQWQIVKLREMEKYRKRNKAILGEYNSAIEKTIEETLKQSFEKGKENVEKQIDTVKDVLDVEIKLPQDEITEKVVESKKPQKIIIEQQGIEDVAPNKVIDVKVETPKMPKNVEELPKAPREENFFGVNDKKLEALQETVTNDLDKAQNAVLRKMDDVYRQTIYKTHVYFQNGTVTLNQAIDMATKDFLDKGINCVEYKNGARVNIASYAEMALRTASHKATLLGEGKKRDEYGMHLVVVSAHANTCKKCLPWQGKVMIDDIFSHPSKDFVEENKQYPLLSEAIEKGLLHPNCRHTLTTYFPGITKLPVVPDEEEALKNYEAEQRQRAIERELRKWKRVKAGACDVENQEKATDKVKELEDKLRQHLKDNPQLRRDYDREKPRLGISNRDVKEKSNLLKSQEKNVNIKRDGASRAKEFSQYWKEASLKDTINKFVPNAIASDVSSKGKIIYSSKDTNLQIVYDTKGNYFRIEDTSRTDKKRYLDIEGNDITNVIENGKKRGTTKGEYQSRTHFKNSDKEV